MMKMIIADNSIRSIRMYSAEPLNSALFEQNSEYSIIGLLSAM